MSKLDPNFFNKPIKELLSKRASQTCSKCGISTSGGNSNPNKATVIGEAAHIEGAKPSERRYDPNMTPEQRRSITNGIWLCGNCHKEIDDDPGKFTVEILHQMKLNHEESVLHDAHLGQGGKGGSAVGIYGGTAIGGRGGKGGLGKGGDGGNSFASGEGSFSMGGEGGEAAQRNRGGKGGRGALEVLMEDFPEIFKDISEKFGITEEMAKKIGKGGDGGG